MGFPRSKLTASTLSGNPTESGQPEIVAVGALRTLAGQILVTAPVAIMAAVQYFTTINSPMPTPAK
ncbi:hypothetical protein AB0L63_24160 [Nocardia sp. NPDC051990]|uniref:hypothetical protein n=1 Tax=Nocardia sp. NPDC051990 TaxID=3155285 RepID=UPI00343DF964